MQRSTDRILVTHVGSLVRPVALRHMIGARVNGKPYDQAEYAKLLHDTVAEVVRLQEAAGVDIPSDGEYGKTGWVNYITDRLTGFQFRVPGPDEPPPINPRIAGREGDRYLDFYAAYAPVAAYDWVVGDEVIPPDPQIAASTSNAWECTSAITYKNADINTDIANFKAALNGRKFTEAFMPVAAPESARGVRRNRFYKNDDAFLEAIANALREEYDAILAAGFLIQLDDAFLAHEYDRLLVTQDEKTVHRGFEAYVEMLNHALRGIPEDKIRYHVCWGSWNGPHTSDVPLRQIVDLVLKVRAQAYSLEAANPRHAHEFQVWEQTKLPDGKILIPGLISHATNVVEHPDLIAMRIKNFAKSVGRENVIAGTDCGFSQGWATLRTHPSIQWAKLEALAEGARRASLDLWRR